MTTRPAPERYTLTLAACPDRDGIPAVNRLRRLLKYALRVCGLKCIGCVPAKEKPELENTPCEALRETSRRMVLRQNLDRRS